MERIVEPIIYDYDGFEKICQLLCSKYKFISSHIISKTYNNRNIRMLRLGSARECVLYCASMHGNESITATLILKLIEDICICLDRHYPLSGIDINRMLQSRSYIFIPFSNPDGCEIAQKGDNAKVCNIDDVKRMCMGEFHKWKANAGGIDINRNFAVSWERTSAISEKYGITSPGPQKFGGYYPNSEPETLALINICKSFRPNHIISLHTQGEVIYYGWENANKAEIRMAQILSLLSGYALEEPEEISQGGGFKDWFVRSFGRPGFTIECGKGENPLPESEISAIYKRIFEMLAVSLIM